MRLGSSVGMMDSGAPRHLGGAFRGISFVSNQETTAGTGPGGAP